MTQISHIQNYYNKKEIQVQKEKLAGNNEYKLEVTKKQIQLGVAESKHTSL